MFSHNHSNCSLFLPHVVCMASALGNGWSINLCFPNWQVFGMENTSVPFMNFHANVGCASSKRLSAGFSGLCLHWNLSWGQMRWTPGAESACFPGRTMKCYDSAKTGSSDGHGCCCQPVPKYGHPTFVEACRLNEVSIM